MELIERNKVTGGCSALEGMALEGSGKGGKQEYYL